MFKNKAHQPFVWVDTNPVVPAKAGTQVVTCPEGAYSDASHGFTYWIPAFAGMTDGDQRHAGLLQVVLRICDSQKIVMNQIYS
jgi:hypothetical protein